MSAVVTSKTPVWRTALGRGAVALAAGALGLTALAGCANPIEQLVENATGVDVTLPGGSLPDGFPSEVPLVDGELVAGAALEVEGQTVYNVTIKTAEDPAAQVSEALEAAGFSDQGSGGLQSDQGQVFAVSNAEWSVLVIVTKTDTEWHTVYTVTPATP